MLDNSDLVGRTMYAQDGDKIGEIGQVYIDEQTGRPEFLTVKTGMFGGSENFVPIEGAHVLDDKVTVPFTKDKVKDAPSIDDHERISEREEGDVFRYYGMHYEGTPTGDAGQATMTGASDESSGTATGDAMTRSEEQLNVGTTQSRATDRARLRRWVETEESSVKAPATFDKAAAPSEENVADLGSRHVDRGHGTAAPSEEDVADLGSRHVDRGHGTGNR